MQPNIGIAADGGWCDPERPRLKPRVQRTVRCDQIVVKKAAG